MRIQEFRKFKIFFPAENEGKKEIVKPIVEEVEEELENPDDGEGEG